MVVEGRLRGLWVGDAKKQLGVNPAAAMWPDFVFYFILFLLLWFHLLIN